MKASSVSHNLRSLDYLLKDNGIVEIRAQATNGSWYNGYFDNFNDIQRAVGKLDGFNCYTSLNRPANKFVSNAIGLMRVGSGLSDSDIARITRLPFDFDPKRPTGVTSTEAELHASLAASRALARFLHSQGFAEPLRANSGNGHHVQYRVNLLNTDETREYLRFIYQGLASRYSTEGADFDVKVRNPARIFRLYGTVNRKGERTQARPYRRSFCYVPVSWGCVSQRQIARLAESLRPAVEASRRKVEVQSCPNGSGDYKTLDIVGLFSANGLYKRSLQGGKHAVTCPWCQEHSTPDVEMGSDTVIWERGSSGYPNFSCSHAHCQGRGLFDAIAQLSGADDFCAQRFGS